MPTEWFFRLPETFFRITYWRDISLEAMRSRRVDSFVRLRLFLYHVLNRYVPWSYGTSTNWFFRPPEAFFYIPYWKDTCFEAMNRRQIEFSVRLRLFCVSRIEGIRIRRRIGVRWRRCAAALGWRWQNEKRSRMRLSSGSLRFSRRQRGALCAV